MNEPFNLTPREREIALLVSQGLTTSEISHKLGTSYKTVSHQRASIYKKLHLKGGDIVIRLILLAVKNNWWNLQQTFCQTS